MKYIRLRFLYRDSGGINSGSVIWLLSRGCYSLSFPPHIQKTSIIGSYHWLMQKRPYSHTLAEQVEYRRLT